MTPAELVKVRQYHRQFYPRLLALGCRILARLYASTLEKAVGPFDREKHDTPYHVSNECGFLASDLTDWVKPYSKGKRILLAGESMAITEEVESILGASVTTASLDGGEIAWNFDEPFPKIGSKYDIVWSQYMLEHIVKPYEHLEVLFGLTTSGGLLAVTAASFLCLYHRCPIHTYNIFPDLFETFAKRKGLTVLKRRYSAGIVSYLFKKEQ